MKILIVGNGGREHALAWKLSTSPRCTGLWATRPNAGLATLASAVDVSPDDVDGVVRFCRRAAVDLVVVGPERPLTLGLVDELERCGVRAWGPSAAAARLEGSKAFAKELMTRAGVPTAEFGIFDEVDAARAWVRALGRPVAVKADGLAAGKGVLLCETVAEADAALDTLMVGGAFGGAGRTVVVEELLRGEEVSFIALCDGENVVPLASSQDHKRIGEGDTGPNTGGMGAYSPAPVVSDALAAEVVERVLRPVVATLAGDGTPFVGFLYAGLMITERGPMVLEFNVRLGDPETQPLLMRLQGDLVELMLLGLEGRLDVAELTWDPRPALCVVMASAGYPASSRIGDVIDGLELADDEEVRVFHASTRADEAGAILTAGGRVLGVTALGEDLPAAAAAAYRRVDAIRWPGVQLRRDIGWRALKPSSVRSGAR